MATAETAPRAASKHPHPWVRIVARTADGTIHCDWPIERIGEAIADPSVTTWVDIEDADANLPKIEALFRDVFHFHPLAIEDALQECHVPKLDDWGDYLYMVFQEIQLEADSCAPNLVELDVFLGMNYLVTCHTPPIAAIDTVRKTIDRDAQRLSKGPDHVLYHILDESVAAFMTTIERLDDAIDDAQEEVFDNPSPRTLQRIFQIKKAILRMHRTLSPQREILNRLARDAYKQIDEPDRVYFRDVYDHLVRLHDITESVRDMISGALDTYLSAISNRTNEIMKTLTLVTIMFLPMSFLAGFFGMNFFGDNMVLTSPLPRASLFWVATLLMLGSPVGIWAWAKHRGWF